MEAFLSGEEVETLTNGASTREPFRRGGCSRKQPAVTHFLTVLRRQAQTVGDRAQAQALLLECDHLLIAGEATLAAMVTVLLRLRQRTVGSERSVRRHRILFALGRRSRYLLCGFP